MEFYVFIYELERLKKRIPEDEYKDYRVNASMVCPESCGEKDIVFGGVYGLRKIGKTGKPGGWGNNKIIYINAGCEIMKFDKFLEELKEVIKDIPEEEYRDFRTEVSMCCPEDCGDNYNWQDDVDEYEAFVIEDEKVICINAG